MASRRSFLGACTAALTAGSAQAARELAVVSHTGITSLNGDWLFKLDPNDEGVRAEWFKGHLRSHQDWRPVKVPHTWQVEPENADYRGAAWYFRRFNLDDAKDCCVRVEFEAVFHSAIVWVNGTEAGRHTGKGYTAFTVDVTDTVRPNEATWIAVRVDNAFDDAMLPRGRSSDWAHDGGIYRPVNLVVTPSTYVERIAVDADPDLKAGYTPATVVAHVRNRSKDAWSGRAAFVILDDSNAIASSSPQVDVNIPAGQSIDVEWPWAMIGNHQLWHFDHPHLYTVVVSLTNGHTYSDTFGIRKIETRDGAFFLNGEKVRLMGVERMAGSNPKYGMAEPAEWIEHDHRDMKELNCVYTRVHWPQDRRVLDWCDRHGMFIQTEVPTWGSDTFKGMADEPSREIMRNGLEQLREMIERDRNHPCIFSWGVCNEIGGQNPAAYNFAKTMYEEAKRLDPKRLVTYASNSLQKTPDRDVTKLMDYVMWNEYYESWYKGTPEDLGRNLDEIHTAFPDKAIVISEYGYCACTADRPEGDEKRIEVLRKHDEIFRARPWVAGSIFFDYNDYRTHVGDRGAGVLKQRVHGVVDLYGDRKPSWDVLRHESSPVEAFSVTQQSQQVRVSLRSRGTVPSYALRRYSLRAIAYGQGDIPVEQISHALDDVPADTPVEVTFDLTQPGIERVKVDLLRPNGFSVHTAEPTGRQREIRKPRRM